MAESKEDDEDGEQVSIRLLDISIVILFVNLVQ